MFEIAWPILEALFTENGPRAGSAGLAGSLGLFGETGEFAPESRILPRRVSRLKNSTKQHSMLLGIKYYELAEF